MNKNRPLHSNGFDARVDEDAIRQSSVSTEMLCDTKTARSQLHIRWKHLRQCLLMMRWWTVRYDDLARMLAFEKPPGTLIQFRYSTTPDPGQAITERHKLTRTGRITHTGRSLLQSSNLDCIEILPSLPYRRSVLTMWIRVPPKKRGNSTLSALADFKTRLRK